MTINSYIYDGTPEGFQLMLKRKYPKSKNKFLGSYDVRQKTAYIYDTGELYQKGDSYQINVPEDKTRIEKDYTFTD